MRKLIMLLFVLAAASMLLWGVGNAVAGAGDLNCQERFHKYDINRDGMVTPEEYKMTYNEGQYMGTVPNPSGQTPAFIEFDSLDTGAKGFLTEADFCAGRR
jgi:hypothetical protein